MDYLFQGPLDNKVHDISYDQLMKLFKDNLFEEKKTREITESSYRGETFFNSDHGSSWEFDQEFQLRDPRTSGTRIYYPHGIILQQGGRRNYYRGENRIYSNSVPTLLRTLGKYKTRQEKERYRLISDMRIAEFKCLLQKFRHVTDWKYGDVLYDLLAQHYGLETGWLDITSDFNVALFFATCQFQDGKWRPLTKEDTEIDEKHQYGIIFHMPSNRMPVRITRMLENLKIWTDQPVGTTKDGKEQYGRLEYPQYRSEMPNIVYPIGFQPFMRCHMQNGYAIYMREPKPLQTDKEFEKLRFRHSEKLSREVFEMMDAGKKVYPHEGLLQAQFIIDEIRNLKTFSEEAFRYALYRSHMYKTEDADRVLEELRTFENITVVNRHPWKISSGRKRKIDKVYQDFSCEEWYGILVIGRKIIPKPSPFFEPWMYPEKNDGEGIKEFRARDYVDCDESIATRNATSLLYTLKHARMADF